MLSVPKEPTDGEKVIHWARAVTTFLHSITPRESADVMPQVTLTGTYYRTRRRGGGGGGVAPHPFQLIDVSVEHHKQIRVLRGTVNGTAPVGFSPGDTPPYIIKDPGEKGYIYVEVTTDPDDYSVNSVTLGYGSSVPDDTNDETGGDYHLEIGTWGTSTAPDGSKSLVLNTTVAGSLGFALCGGSMPEWGTL